MHEMWQKILFLSWTGCYQYKRFNRYLRAKGILLSAVLSMIWTSRICADDQAIITQTVLIVCFSSRCRLGGRSNDGCRTDGNLFAMQKQEPELGDAEQASLAASAVTPGHKPQLPLFADTPQGQLQPSGWDSMYEATTPAGEAAVFQSSAKPIVPPLSVCQGAPGL